MSTFGDYNPETVDTAVLDGFGDGFQPWPAGDYQVQLESCEMKTTKAGDGKYLKCCYRCVDGKVAYPLFDNITFENKNAKAQNIGQAQFKMLHTACGVQSPKEPFELCGKTIVISVNVRKRADGTMENRITKWLPASAQTVAATEVSTAKPAWAAE